MTRVCVVGGAWPRPAISTSGLSEMETCFVRDLTDSELTVRYSFISFSDQELYFQFPAIPKVYGSKKNGCEGKIKDTGEGV